MRFVVAVLSSLVVGLSSIGPSLAAQSYEAPFTFEQTYSSSIRLLRIDFDCKITEVDEKAGYILFEYRSPESGRNAHRGSFELVRGGERVHVTVRLPDLPSYHERVLIDALARKLTGEHVAPPKRAPSSPAPGSPAPPKDDAATGGNSASSPFPK